MNTWGRMGDIWDDQELLLENRQARAGEKGGGGGLTVKGRDVKHAYITYTQQFLHTHHASTGPFFCLFRYHIIRNNNTTGSKTAESIFPSKRKEDKQNGLSL